MPSSVSDNISADSETEEIMKAAAAETEPVRESDGEDSSDERPTKKRKSNYRGVCWDNRERRFVARIKCGGKRRVGSWDVEADGAWAVDELSRALEPVKSIGKYNFDSFESYKRARALEIEAMGVRGNNICSIDDVLLKINHRVEEIKIALSANPSAEKKQQYRCVSFHKTTGKYRAKVKYRDTTHDVGSFDLKADAAYSVDAFVGATRGPKAKYNFTDMASYKTARTAEIESTGKTIEEVESVEEILAKIQTCVEEIKSNVENDENTDKKMDTTSTTLSTAKRETYKSPYRSVYHDKSKRRFRASVTAFNKRINMGDFVFENDAAFAVDQASSVLGVSALRMNFSSREAYIQARELEAKEADSYKAKHAISIEDADRKIQQRLKNVKSDLRASGVSFGKAKLLSPDSDNLTSINDDTLPFPKGCPIMTGFDLDEDIILKGETATIAGASIDLNSREIFYTATYNDEDKSGETALFHEKEVAYAIGCAVRYNPPGEENSIPGKVLLCQTKRVEENQWGKSITAPASQKAHVFYTIQFFHGGSKGKFQVIRDVSPHHLKFDNDQD